MEDRFRVLIAACVGAVLYLPPSPGAGAALATIPAGRFHIVGVGRQ